MPREKETSRKRHAKGKRMKERRQEKDDKTSRERDFQGKGMPRETDVRKE